MAVLCDNQLAEEFANIVSQRMKHRANAILSIGKLRGQWELPYSTQANICERLRRAQSGTVESNAYLRACFNLVLAPSDDLEMLFVFVPKENPAFCILKSNKVRLTQRQINLAMQSDSGFLGRMEQFAVQIGDAFVSSYQAPDRYRVCAHDKMHMWCLTLSNE